MKLFRLFMLFMLFMLVFKANVPKTPLDYPYCYVYKHYEIIITPIGSPIIQQGPLEINVSELFRR